MRFAAPKIQKSNPKQNNRRDKQSTSLRGTGCLYHKLAKQQHKSYLLQSKRIEKHMKSAKTHEISYQKRVKPTAL